MTKFGLLVAGIFLAGGAVGCNNHQVTSDDKERAAQEKLQAEAFAQTGTPNIKNFRERRILKDIYEMRDSETLLTYTYLQNTIPYVIPGVTARGGSLVFLGDTIGFGIPAATQFSNPHKLATARLKTGYSDNPAHWHQVSGSLPQAEPNALFSPGSAEGTWIMMINTATKKAEPQYVEPRVLVFTFKWPFDGDVAKKAP